MSEVVVVAVITPKEGKADRVSGSSPCRDISGIPQQSVTIFKYPCFHEANLGLLGRRASPQPGRLRPQERREHPQISSAQGDEERHA